MVGWVVMHVRKTDFEGPQGGRLGADMLSLKIHLLKSWTLEL